MWPLFLQYLEVFSIRFYKREHLNVSGKLYTHIHFFKQCFKTVFQMYTDLMQACNSSALIPHGITKAVFLKSLLVHCHHFCITSLPQFI